MATRVLICEDSPPIRELMTTVLRRSGMVVDALGDGGDCLATINAATYDAIVLDLLLPGTGGVEIIAALRSSRPSILPRIVVATASAREAKELSHMPGIGAVVMKPFELTDLVHAVERAAATPRDDA